MLHLRLAGRTEQFRIVELSQDAVRHIFRGIHRRKRPGAPRCHENPVFVVRVFHGDRLVVRRAVPKPAKGNARFRVGHIRRRDALNHFGLIGDDGKDLLNSPHRDIAEPVIAPILAGSERCQEPAFGIVLVRNRHGLRRPREVSIPVSRRRLIAYVLESLIRQDGVIRAQTRRIKSRVVIIGGARRRCFVTAFFNFDLPRSAQEIRVIDLRDDANRVSADSVKGLHNPVAARFCQLR